MGVPNAEMTEATLLKLHQFVIGNCLALRDACHLLDAVTKRKQVIYQVDFSDIHPYIFPSRTREDIDLGRSSLQGMSLKFMWDSLLNANDPEWAENIRGLPFRLALSPATRLEALEALWHAEKRIYKQFRKYAADIIPHIKIKHDHVAIPDSGALYEYMKTWDGRKFLPRLRDAISDDNIKRYLKEPVDTLTWLFDSQIIQNLEECLPESVISDVMQMEYPSDISCYTELLYAHPARLENLPTWSKEHDLFHDKVDELNINLAYSITKSPSAAGYYIPLLTHTGRVIRVGTSIMDYAKCSIVNHSLAPLYIAVARRQLAPDELPSYFSLGKALIVRIAKEMRQMKEMAALFRLDDNELQDRLSRDKPVVLGEALMTKLEMFTREYYALIEGTQSQPAEGGAREMPAVTRRVGIFDVIELFKGMIAAVKQIRREAGTLKATFAQQNVVLAGIFEPLDCHAQEVSDWLIRQDNIDLIGEITNA